MPSPLNAQLCKRIVKLHAVQQAPNAEIARRLEVDPKTVAAVLGRWRRGEPLEKRGRQGIADQRTKFTRAHGYAHLSAILAEYECAYLDEIAAELHRRSGVAFSTATVCRAIKRLGWTNKKLNTRAREANRVHRTIFRHRMRAMYRWPQFVWMDEVSKDRRHHQRSHGWAPRGRRTRSRVWFQRGQRYTTIGVMSARGMLDWYSIRGAANSADMVRFAKQSLVPHLRPFPQPHSVLVLDNCKIHKDPAFVRLIESTGAIIEFLPAYSPDYNPIEKVFGQTKAWLRRYGAWADRVPGFMAIDRALSNVTCDDCLAYIRCSGDMYMQP